MRVLTAGAHALLVEVGDVGEVRAAYQQILAMAGESGLGAPLDIVPGARTVLIDGVGDQDGWRRALPQRLASRGDRTPTETVSGSDVTIRLSYDGPDLYVVAQAWDCDPDEVVRRHQDSVYTVAFSGFAPGFAYCTAEPPQPQVSRRDNPRESVPVGSVALAGEYCGIYPRTMPGGWQLIGTTSAVMFDPAREAPALLQPGDRVTFEAAT